MAFDLVIRGGRVVDGGGMPAFVADVAVRHGRIARIGRVAGAAKRVIDADGAVVTPGHCSRGRPSPYTRQERRSMRSGLDPTAGWIVS
jgi:predicted amidohydrolase